jgi:hypothetical protein
MSNRLTTLSDLAKVGTAVATIGVISPPAAAAAVAALVVHQVYDWVLDERRKGWEPVEG